MHSTQTPSASSGSIAVVGAGIVGLAHAYLAVRSGLRVTLVDEDSGPRGASVRNFGHCCITGQTGAFASLAEAGREHWLAAASAAGFWARESGAYVAAASAQELRVLAEAAEAKGTDRIRLVDGEEITRALGSRATSAVGGAHLPLDLRVDPRTAAPRLAAWLHAHPAVTMCMDTRALSVTDGGVHTTRGFLAADHTFVCTGHHLRGLLPDLAADAGIRECALQMALVDAPAHFTTDAAILTGTSLLRYDAFATMPAAQDLREHMEETAPALMAAGANVMVTRRPDGSLLVGDSHAYAPSTAPFLDEDTTDLLLESARSVLGARPLRVRQRWQGVYASSETRPLVLAPAGAHATVVTVATGVGMTLAFGLATHTLEALHTGSPAAAAPAG